MTLVTGAWLHSAAIKEVFDLLESAGHRVYAVGGCVRNDLLGTRIDDIDMATSAHPDDVMALAQMASLKAIPTGRDHGTITVVSHETAFEITTFRRDVSTDGRHAVVSFSDRPADDAQRRDFTMNALYADRYGQVLDFVGGLADLRARRIRFIGDASRRIAEDYLRILRYFRFLAWYGDPAAGVEPDALAPLTAHLDGLGALSKERGTKEILRLFSAPSPGFSVAAMERCGVAMAVLGPTDLASLQRYLHWEEAIQIAPDALARLSAFSGRRVVERLRLTKAQSKQVTGLLEAVEASYGTAEMGYRLGVEQGAQAALLSAAILETNPPSECLV